jgi:hypothetical protein
MVPSFGVCPEKPILRSVLGTSLLPPYILTPLLRSFKVYIDLRISCVSFSGLSSFLVFICTVAVASPLFLVIQNSQREPTEIYTF